MAAPPEPKHGRKLVIGGVSLTSAKFGIAQGRIKKKEYFTAANDARNRIEQLVIDDAYCDDQPFTWIGLIIREGLVNDEMPKIGKVDPKYGDLELTIEIDTNDLIDVGKEEIQRVLELATLKSLIAAGKKFGCKMGKISAELEALKA